MPPLPPYVVGLPALELSVIDSKSLGVPWVALNASVFSFNGLCSQGLPILTTSNATVMTDRLGRAQITGNLDVTGCSVGELVLKITAMSASVTRFARVVLFEPSTAKYSHSVSTTSTKSLDPYTEVVTVRRDLTRCFADPLFVN